MIKIIKNESGAALVEYALLTSLVTVSLFATVIKITDINFIANYLEIVSKAFLEGFSSLDDVKDILFNLYENY